MLRKASISAIHYSKNLPLATYTTASMVIKDVNKNWVGKRLDGTMTHFPEGGIATRFHTNGYEIILYDKIKDMERSKISDKRAIEDDNATQLSLFKALERLPKRLEIVRLEVRLKRTKLKEVLASLGYKKDYNFQSLFSEIISKKILCYYWGLITTDMSLLAASHFAPEELYDTICRDHPGVRPATVLQRVGALAIVKAVGVPGLRALVLQNGTSRTWHRLSKDLKCSRLSDRMKFSAIREATIELNEFRPLRLEKYRANLKLVRG